MGLSLSGGGTFPKGYSGHVQAPPWEFWGAGGSRKPYSPLIPSVPGFQSSPHHRVWACGLLARTGDKGHPAGRTWAA